MPAPARKRKALPDNFVVPTAPSPERKKAVERFIQGEPADTATEEKEKLFLRVNRDVAGRLRRYCLENRPLPLSDAAEQAFAMWLDEKGAPK